MHSLCKIVDLDQISLLTTIGSSGMNEVHRQQTIEILLKYFMKNKSASVE
jgi:hypothetical protein